MPNHLSRMALGFTLAAGHLASAQEVINISTTWSEMVAGTNTPVLNPNGLVEPGEGAMIGFGMHALRNGTSPVGQSIPVPPPGGGGGTVMGTGRGFGSWVYDLSGTGADATGTWTHRAISPIFTFFPNTGVVEAGGAKVSMINSAQQWHIAVDPTNPIPLVWRGVWNPNSYDTRTVHFQLAASIHVPVGQQNSFLVECGIDPSNGNPLYWGIYYASDFGSGVDIPIGPSLSPFTYLCYPDCDGLPQLNANDVMCFINLFSSGSSLANCDGSNRTPLLTANDLICYLNRFAAGCT